MECLFCKLVKGDVPTKKVHEDEDTLGFLDINPCTPGHTVVIPKKHYQFISDMPEEESEALFRSVVMLSGKIKKSMNAKGLNIGTNDGKAAGAEIPHVHIHIIPRYENDHGGSMQTIVRMKIEREKLDEIADKIKSSPDSEHKDYDDYFKY